MKKLLILLLLILLCSKTYSQDKRDSLFDVLHYSINLDVKDFTGKKIKGRCHISFRSRIDSLKVFQIDDLYGLSIDSIIDNNKQRNLIALPKDTLEAFTGILLKKHLLLNDTTGLDIYYSGSPKQDPNGWGGWYWSGDYAFNLGVSFALSPHNFGRCWFPCVDNFTDKASYSFYITTKPNHKAFCGGDLMDSLIDSSRALWHYELKEPVCSYLASVAVGVYATLKFTYHGIVKDFEVIYGVPPSNIKNAQATFANMPKVLACFEQHYGPYPQSKVGLVGVNFNAGAMEHVGNIAFPNAFTNGTTTYETTWAHELSHMWWGDNTTCNHERDMWLNEGWASYSEELMTECVNNSDVSRGYSHDNHYYVLENAAKKDGGYYKLDSIPTKVTYGQHVYNKGADVIHTLRGQMGDSLFFQVCKAIQKRFAFRSLSTKEYTDFIDSFCNFDMSNFTKNWLSTTGHPHYYIKSYKYYKLGKTPMVDIEIGQDLKEGTHLFNGVKAEIGLIDSARNVNIKNVIINGAVTKATISLADIAARIPVYVLFDPYEKIKDASSREYRLFLTPMMTADYQAEKFKIISHGPSNVDLMFVSYHRLGPANRNIQETNMRLSSERYWSVGGLIFPSTDASAEIVYDGRPGGPDEKLFSRNVEDSIKLYFRSEYDGNWVLYPYYTITAGLKNDKFGVMKLTKLMQGEYCLALQDKTAAVKENSGLSLYSNEYIKVYPSPAKDYILAQPLDKETRILSLSIYTLTGNKIIGTIYPLNTTEFKLNTSMLRAGNYILKIQTSNGLFSQQVFIGQ